MPYFYYYDCESSVIEKIIEFEDLTDQGYDVFGITLPNCNIDGKYGLVQMNSTQLVKFITESNIKKCKTYIRIIIILVNTVPLPMGI